MREGRRVRRAAHPLPPPVPARTSPYRLATGSLPSPPIPLATTVLTRPGSPTSHPERPNGRPPWPLVRPPSALPSRRSDPRYRLIRPIARPRAAVPSPGVSPGPADRDSAGPMTLMGGLADDPEVPGRFHREADAVALLRRPDVVGRRAGRRQRPVELSIWPAWLRAALFRGESAVGMRCAARRGRASPTRARRAPPCRRVNGGRASYHAGEIVGAVSAEVVGKGGGRPDMAQGGGMQPERLDAALDNVYEMV